MLWTRRIPVLTLTSYLKYLLSTYFPLGIGGWATFPPLEFLSRGRELQTTPSTQGKKKRQLSLEFG